VLVASVAPVSYLMSGRLFVDSRFRNMKKHLSTFLFGFLGFSSGFILCYIVLVLPREQAANLGNQPLLVMKSFNKPNWQPDLINPMIPPKIVEK
jgi:hypothetical protein